MATVKFEGIWKQFGDVVALRDLTLEIKDGEFLVLVGPSGCGKTTTLRLLGGLDTPSYGRITIENDDVTLWPPGKRDIAMVFQSYALYPHMSVYKNLAFGPKVRKEDKASLSDRIEDVAELLEIKPYLKRRPSELSGGQRQRVALGRALLRQPRIFLLDEPLSNLDASLRVQMRAELRRLHERLGVTTVYVTHDQVEAMTMGDRVAVFDRGNLLQIGSPKELYDEPTSVFVAGFVGSPKMNFFPGKVSSLRSDSISIAALGNTMDVEGSPLYTDAVAAVTVGIRPTDIYLAPTVPMPESVKLLGVIEVIEHTGSEIFAGLITADGDHLMVRLERSAPAAVGDKIEVEFQLRHLHLFDEESGRRLWCNKVVHA